MKKLRLGASLVAFLVALLPAATSVDAASCNGASHQSTLTDGTVTPGAVSAGQAITFSVVYADTAGCAPSTVAVAVAGAGTFPLRASDTIYTMGVSYSAAVTLPAGTMAYSFSATSGGGKGTTTLTLRAVSPPSVVVLAPTEAATPVPTAAPTPATVVPATRPPAAPTVVAPAPQPPQPPAPPPAATPAAATTASAHATATESPATGADTGPGAAARELSESQGSKHDASDGVAAVASGWTGSGNRPLTEQTVGTFLAAELPLTLGTFATATTGGLALFFLLLRRRRSEPEVATAAVAASEGRASGPMPAATAEPATDGPIEPIKLNLSPIRELVPPIDPYLLEDPDERLGPSPDEAGIPRWLRPSVRSARMGTMELRQRDWKA